MANWTENDLKAQFQRTQISGWLPLFEAAAQTHSFEVELLLAIGSRETNLRNIKGDFYNGIYHGYGIMQVDIGTDPAFCASWTEARVQESIERGTEILAEKRAYLADKGITDPKAIAAAYNTGQGNVVRSIGAGKDPDSTTSGHYYGSDVLARMAIFKNLRAA